MILNKRFVKRLKDEIFPLFIISGLLFLVFVALATIANS
jgi:hypothetical protein